MINELAMNANPPFVELYNHANQSVDLGGAVLTDVASQNKYVFAAGTTIGARGFVTRTPTELGFTPSGTIFFKNPSGTRLVDAVFYYGQSSVASWGRYPDGATWHELDSPTTGSANNATTLRVREIVINEIMFNPITGDENHEYVELHNRSDAAVNVRGWTLGDGIGFTISPHADFYIGAGQYLVIAENAGELMTIHNRQSTVLTPQNTVGNFQGSLKNSGERIALFDNSGALVDEVIYYPGGRWGTWADGGGSSLELIDPESDNRLPSNWGDSDESTKAPWRQLTVSGQLDHGWPHLSTIDALHFNHLGAGECLLDDIQFTGGGVTVANSSFESDFDINNPPARWTSQGNHDTSVLELSGGFNGGRCFRLRATGRGETAANRLRAELTAAAAASGPATISAKVRWLRGHPKLLVRTHGNSLEGAINLAYSDDDQTILVPLGTPARRNSLTHSTPDLVNSAPAMYDVSHSPVLPGLGKVVTITARLHDRHGIVSRRLFYRFEPSAAAGDLAMVDDGTSGDAIANDGIFTAQIQPPTPHSNNNLLAFKIQATDGVGAMAIFPTQSRECLIRFGEAEPPTSSTPFPTYRLWMTDNTRTTWRDRLKLHNGLLDCTFVYGNSRVIYNMTGRYAGSSSTSPSYDAPDGKLCAYTLAMPTDDRLLGATDISLDFPFRDTVGVREQAAYWLAEQMGMPACFRRFIHLYVNGVYPANREKPSQFESPTYVYEDTQQPSGDFVEQWFPNGSSGELHKIDLWEEFDHTGTEQVSQTQVPPTLQEFRSGGALKKGRYRWHWEKRADRYPFDDFDELLDLVPTMNYRGSGFIPALEALVDVDEWMSHFVFHDLIGNWDSYGNYWGGSGGKNGYLYKPNNQLWKLIPFDMDLLLGTGFIHESQRFLVDNEPTIHRLYQYPALLRAYWRITAETRNGPLAAANFDQIMNAKSAALIANGISPSGHPSSIRTWLDSWTTSGLTPTAPAQPSFAVTYPSSESSVTRSDNWISLEGTAPFSATSIKVNDLTYFIDWRTVTDWVARVPLPKNSPETPETVLTIKAYDRFGNQVGSTIIRRAVYNGSLNLGGLVINEWMASNTSAVPDPADGDFEDWIELYNASNAEINIGNYTITDGDDTYTFPANTIIGRGGFLLLWADEEAGQNTPMRKDLHVNFRLGTGDVLALYDAQGTPILPTAPVGPLVENRSRGRFPDGRSDLIDQQLALSSPRGTNILTHPPYPLINEWMANNTGAWDSTFERYDPSDFQYESWIELYNPSSAPFDLSGYQLTLTDDLGNTQWTFPVGSIVPANGYLIIWADNEPDQNRANPNHVHANFVLPATGGTIALYAPFNATATDSLSFSAMSPDESRGRCPNGGTQGAIMAAPTPGEANACP